MIKYKIIAILILFISFLESGDEPPRSPANKLYIKNELNNDIFIKINNYLNLTETNLVYSCENYLAIESENSISF